MARLARIPGQSPVSARSRSTLVVRRKPDACNSVLLD
jgi:hypothetical protein